MKRLKPINDSIELYKAREHSEHEKANIYSSGKDDKAIEIAKKMLLSGMDIETIISLTELERDKVESLKDNYKL